ncbi:HIT domain-containing protein [candidate division WWE3 bacterium]|nr:HIT domain-containing protein [candidate division WWE3 bacterium]
MEQQDPSCLFCKIVRGTEFSVKVAEFGDFLVIRNKYPKAPIHVLVLDKKHREKKNTMSGEHKAEHYWDEMMAAVWQAIVSLGLDKTGYKIINNGAGYNHFEHQHLHIMGGSREEPGGPS